jgi:hypothetical protein
LDQAKTAFLFPQIPSSDNEGLAVSENLDGDEGITEREKVMITGSYAVMLCLRDGFKRARIGAPSVRIECGPVYPARHQS